MGLAELLFQAKDFLAHLATQPGDLSNTPAPPFLLSTKSAVEFPTTWATHQDLFLAQADLSTTSQQRALAVLKNFLCSLRLQLYTGQSEEEGLKKPLNAFLGEVFLGVFEGKRGSTRIWCEQVSHHPPVTACALHNPLQGISAEGYVAQKTTFSPTHGLNIEQLGHAVITVALRSSPLSAEGANINADSNTTYEHHLMTLPTLALKGIFSGTPYPELTGRCHIISSSGFVSEIDFEGKKSMFRFGGSKGEKNSLTGVLYRLDGDDMDMKHRTPLYEVSGRWIDELTITPTTEGKSQGGEEESVDVHKLTSTNFTLAPLNEQDPFESRRAWQHVVEAIKANNFSDVQREKGKIEQAQRAFRKAEKGNDVVWPRIFFKKFGSHGEAGQEEKVVEKLAGVVGLDLRAEKEKTAGVWKFIGFEEGMEILKRGRLHIGLRPDGQDVNQG